MFHSPPSTPVRASTSHQNALMPPPAARTAHGDAISTRFVEAMCTPSRAPRSLQPLPRLDESSTNFLKKLQHEEALQGRLFEPHNAVFRKPTVSMEEKMGEAFVELRKSDKNIFDTETAIRENSNAYRRARQMKEEAQAKAAEFIAQAKHCEHRELEFQMLYEANMKQQAINQSKKDAVNNWIWRMQSLLEVDDTDKAFAVLSLAMVRKCVGVESSRDLHHLSEEQTVEVLFLLHNLAYHLNPEFLALWNDREFAASYAGKDENDGPKVITALSVPVDMKKRLGAYLAIPYDDETIFRLGSSAMAIKREEEAGAGEPMSDENAAEIARLQAQIAKLQAGGSAQE